MHESVKAHFPAFSAPLEGKLTYMYADIKGLVTTGIGNLIDPIPLALGLPWANADGTPATQAQIRQAWHAVKDDPHAASRGHLYAQRLTSIRLTGEGVDALVRGKMAEFEHVLMRRFPSWEAWPADAQLATLSMAWACGPAFRFGNLERALRREDFAGAAASCHINEQGNAGIVPRNRLNKLMYRTAATVKAHDMDRSLLHYQGASDREADDVKTLQMQLDDLGFDPGQIDGIAGPRTRQAIATFQSWWNMKNIGQPLTRDGIAGPKTRTALDMAHARLT